MRQYSSPAAFRASVDAHLRNRARRLGVAAYIVRRQAALERLVARLMKTAPGRWALKGGLGLEVRLGDHARPSVDLDADHVKGAAAAREDLQRAAAEDLGDYFGFAIAGSEELREGDISLAIRYRIDCSVGGRPFEPLQVDVSVAAPEPWDAEPGQRPGLLGDVGLGPVDVLVVPLERQLAEKIHAFTRRYDGASTRAKDLVDFVLVLRHERVDAKRLSDAIQRTFARRGTRPVPEHLPEPPPELAVAYRREARMVGVIASLEEAHKLAMQWLNPVLASAARGSWDPGRAEWIE